MNSFVGLVAAAAALAASTNSPGQSPPSSNARLDSSSTAAIVELSGRVTAADKGSYQEHAFEVPAGVTRLDVEFSYENRNAGTELEIGLFDPERFRGTSRFSKQRFHVAEFEATPSYIPGPIVAGTWRVSLGVPAIGSDMTSGWRVGIRMSTAATAAQGLGPTLLAQPNWYVGDLHAHTLHSDGYGCEDRSTPGVKRGCQPWELVEAARARQLDFLAITDHNTTSHHADLATLQESLTTLLLVRGQEVTTFRGHANVYGTSRVIDFRLGYQGRSILDVVNDVAARGALLSINHPGRETGDRCTGCGWDAPHTPWDRVEAMEVVNGPNVEGGVAGMPIWYRRLNEGYRITGIGGSDDHGATPHGRVGTPATVVFADELSEPALIAGIRSGRVYIRSRGPEGPSIHSAARAGEQTVHMGGTLRVAGPAPVRLDLRIERASGQKVEIVRNGETVAALDVPLDVSTLSHTLDLAIGQWVHIRLRDTNGITALSNPVYVKSTGSAAPGV